MLGRQRIIPKKDADAIVRGLTEILEEFARGEFQLRDDLEDVHMNVEARLAEKIGAAAGRLHTARSRNDQVATDFRMYAKSAASRTIGALLDLQAALIDLAEREQGRRDAGLHAPAARAAGPPRAPPARLLSRCSRATRCASRSRSRWPTSCRSAAARSPAWRTRSTATPSPDELGFSRISENSIDAVSDRDFVADYLYAAALTAVHLSRLAEELVLWSSAEFGFIRLPDAFATGSSIMPQKKNPDVAELARGRTGRVIGDLVAMLTTLKGLPLAYNRDLQEDKPAFFDAEDTLVATLDRVRGNVVTHRGRCEARAGGRLGAVLAGDGLRRLPRPQGPAVPRGARGGRQAGAARRG